MVLVLLITACSKDFVEADIGPIGYKADGAFKVKVWNKVLPVMTENTIRYKGKPGEKREQGEQGPEGQQEDVGATGPKGEDGIANTIQYEFTGHDFSVGNSSSSVVISKADYDTTAWFAYLVNGNLVYALLG